MSGSETSALKIHTITGTKTVGEVHANDPRDELLKTIGQIADHVQVLNAKVLVAIYMRPEKTAGGIIRPGTNREEDNYQGKIGLILKAGPLAFEDDDNHKWAIKPKVGDWVQYRVGDTFPFRLGSDKTAPHLRYVEDVNILSVWDRPDLVW